MRKRILILGLGILAVFLVAQSISPVVEVTKSYAILDSDNEANPGDVVKYTVVIKNNSDVNAEDVVFEDTPDVNTTLLTESIMTTPIARQDNFNMDVNSALQINEPGILENDNDADGKGPALVVSGYTAVSNNGGNVFISPAGGFTYESPFDYVGADTFSYTIDDGEGNTKSANVIVHISGVNPSTTGEIYSTLLYNSLFVDAGAGPPAGLIFNDNLGTPTATLVSFGSGQLGGTVTSYSAGSSVSLAGGTLTINADGSFSLENPTSLGVFSFKYRISNGAGYADGTVSIEVEITPAQAFNDGPYAVNLNESLVVDPVAGPPDGLLVNDNLGLPAAIITSFGGGSLGGHAGTYGSGTLVQFAGGSLVVNYDGSFRVISPTIAGSYSFDYRINNASGASDATVTINIGL